jgi:hypothetical protein
VEYTDYFVAKESGAALRSKLKKLFKRGMIMDTDTAASFTPFVVLGKTDKLPTKLPWLVRVFDAEGSAWGFTLWIDGKQIAKATYGDNAEWGISKKDNKLVGDASVAAKAFGTTTAKLEKTLNAKGVEKFCKLVGFQHQYMLYPHERELPEDIGLFSEFE